MSRSWGQSVYQVGDTVEKANLRLAAAGHFDGVTANIRVPARLPEQSDGRYVLRNIDDAIAEFFARHRAFES